MSNLLKSLANCFFQNGLYLLMVATQLDEGGFHRALGSNLSKDAFGRFEEKGLSGNRLGAREIREAKHSPLDFPQI
jgi:hypothetical protein